ncbi:unnamed protein product [Phytomonas sp. EM1]|nr:unnamed protein product [Phytomonas sp. EM1]|eukprot:CCW65063.1 unnamed protein product [Phytomonas sp. isolate EM1]
MILILLRVQKLIGGIFLNLYVLLNRFTPLGKILLSTFLVVWIGVAPREPHVMWSSDCRGYVFDEFFFTILLVEIHAYTCMRIQILCSFNLTRDGSGSCVPYHMPESFFCSDS